MHYKTENIYNTEDALFEVNKQNNIKQPDILKFTHFLNEYSVDFINQVITINDIKQSLKLPKNNENARWVNFRRVTQEISTGNKTFVYFIGFQITIENVCYKRMIKITDDKYELVEFS